MYSKELFKILFAMFQHVDFVSPVCLSVVLIISPRQLYDRSRQSLIVMTLLCVPQDAFRVWRAPSGRIK